MAAWLCRQWTGANLRELGVVFGLTGIYSVSNLVRRAASRRAESIQWRERESKILLELGLTTKYKADPYALSFPPTVSACLAIP